MYTVSNVYAGLAMAAYKENDKLQDFFKVISLSIDKSGNPYVSTLEGREFPFVATQVRAGLLLQVLLG